MAFGWQDLSLTSIQQSFLGETFLDSLSGNEANSVCRIILIFYVWNSCGSALF